MLKRKSLDYGQGMKGDEIWSNFRTEVQEAVVRFALDGNPVNRTTPKPRED